MNFFARQDEARRASRRLVGLFGLAVLAVVAAVDFVVFMLMRLVPGDPALLILGDSATPEQLAALRAAWGLDKPIGLQFFYWLGQVVQGDLGQSITSSEPVLPLLLQRFQVSASIVLVAVALAVLLAVPAGLYAAWKQNSIVDTVVVATATFFLSIPLATLYLSDSLTMRSFHASSKWRTSDSEPNFSRSPMNFALVKSKPSQVTGTSSLNTSLFV